MGELRLNDISYSGNQGALLLNGIDYTGGGGGGGGGGITFDHILDHGMISSLSAYVTQTFEDVSNYEMIFVRVYTTLNGTTYEDFFAVPTKILNSTIILTATRLVNGKITGAVSCHLTKTSIDTFDYRGDWQEIFADIVGTTSNIFE